MFHCDKLCEKQRLCWTWFPHSRILGEQNCETTGDHLTVWNADCKSSCLGPNRGCIWRSVPVGRKLSQVSRAWGMLAGGLVLGLLWVDRMQRLSFPAHSCGPRTGSDLVGFPILAPTSRWGTVGMERRVFPSFVLYISIWNCQRDLRQNIITFGEYKIVCSLAQELPHAPPPSAPRKKVESVPKGCCVELKC